MLRENQVSKYKGKCKKFIRVPRLRIAVAGLGANRKAWVKPRVNITVSTPISQIRDMAVVEK